ncbi:MAG: MgtC/SapB family protein [Planctomycetota bacterium]
MFQATTGIDATTVQDFGTALLLGALLGIEREKRNMREGFGIAGLRSFVLLALLGAAGGHMGAALAMPWILPAVVVVVGVVVAVGYVAGVRQRPEQVGLTTELAAVAACLLGAMATTGFRDLAIGLGVGMAALLAYKQPLHQLVGQLGWEDVLVGMRLLLATFIVLPLLPDRAIDPWGAINPYKLWLLVLLISGMSLVGYIATRWLGPGRGIAVTAASGGLVSSTAVTLAFAKQSRDEPQRARALAGGVLLAWAVMFVRVAAIAAVVQPPLALALAVPCAATTAVCAGAAAVAMRSHAGGGADGLPAVPMQNPFSLLAASKFAALFAVVQLLLKLGQQHLPQSGVYAVAALAGLTDVDAITVSMAERVRAAPADVGVAATAILVACLANTVVKTGMAIGMGRGLARTVVVGAVAAVAAGAATLLL